MKGIQIRDICCDHVRHRPFNIPVINALDNNMAANTSKGRQH